MRYPTNQQPLPVKSMQQLGLQFAVLFKKPMVYHYNLSAKMPYCLQLLKVLFTALSKKRKQWSFFVVNFLTNGPITRWEELLLMNN